MITHADVPVASPEYATAGELRSCVRPGCRRTASSTLRFDYGARTVMLDPLGPSTAPGTYDLCFAHAARSTPPSGWTLRDRAPSRPPAAEPSPPVGPDRGRGVARLAAALSAVPRAVSEDAPDAAPDGTDRSVGDGPVDDRSVDSRPVDGRSPLDSLMGRNSSSVPTVPSAVPSAVPAAVVPPSRVAERADRPAPQSLRLAPDPTTTVWCAGLLGGPPTSTGAPTSGSAATHGPSVTAGVSTLFG